MKTLGNKRVHPKKVVINTCFGGFGLSYAAVMEYARMKKIKLYAFVDGRDDKGSLKLGSYVPYVPGSKAFCIHYFTKPLKKDGHYRKDSYFSPREIRRDDTKLVKVVEKLGMKANGDCAELKVVEIPDDIEWSIHEYDGNESIEENHRSWS